MNNNVKLIMLDLVGVLIFEKDNVLNDKEDKIERLFGPNLSDEEYLNNKINIIYDKNELMLNSRFRYYNFLSCLSGSEPCTTHHAITI